MRVALVGGTGRLGSALAWRLAEKGHHVIVGSRSFQRAVNAAALAGALSQGGAPVEGARNADAVRHAEVAVLTVPACGQAAVLREIAPAARGRVVIDTCVCHDGRTPGRWVRPPAGSSAMQVRRAMPRSAAVGATLHATSSRTLRDPRRFPPGDVPVVADGRAALEAATYLLDELGLPWVVAGGLEVAAALEHLAVLLRALADAHGVPTAAARFHARPVGERGGLPLGGASPLGSAGRTPNGARW